MALPMERPAKLAVAVAAASAVVLIVVFGRRRKGDVHSEDREKVLAILEELSRRFFHVCRNIAGIAKMVRIKVQQNKTNISEESLRAQLSLQCKVFESLNEIQADVAKKYGCTPDDIQSMQQRLMHCPSVRAYADGFKTMLDDALCGELPLLPNTQIPADLTQEKVLEIQAQAQVLETTKIEEKLIPTNPFDSAALQEASMTAFSDTLSKWEALLGGKDEVYYNAVATYMKDPAFRTQRQALDETHQQRVTKIIRAFAQKGSLAQKASP